MSILEYVILLCSINFNSIPYRVEARLISDTDQGLSLAENRTFWSMYMTTPKIVRTLGVNTPPKVPNRLVFSAVEDSVS